MTGHPKSPPLPPFSHERLAVTKARRVKAALLRIGWRVKRQCGTSHCILSRDGYPDFVFAFHDSIELGPAMLARIARHTNLKPQDL